MAIYGRQTQWQCAVCMRATQNMQRATTRQRITYTTCACVPVVYMHQWLAYAGSRSHPVGLSKFVLHLRQLAVECG